MERASAGHALRRALAPALGALAGIALAELGLRLALYDYEAMGGYWGRGAFVSDAELVYRHAPSATAWAGREGSFGPVRVTTNPRGFRDRRELPATDPSGRRLAVGGASLIFGLGVEGYEDLFHVRLERRLRLWRPDWPRDVEVYNLSQTGHDAARVVRQVERELTRLQPSAVILALRSFRPARHRAGARVDIVDGFRLPRDRPFAGSWLDALRTRSYLFMRRGRYFARAAAESEEPDPPREQTEAELARFQALLAGFDAELARRGIGLFGVVIHNREGHSVDADLVSSALTRQGVAHVVLDPEPDWYFHDDGHWNAAGHGAAASRVARALPSPDALARSPQTR